MHSPFAQPEYFRNATEITDGRAINRVIAAPPVQRIVLRSVDRQAGSTVDNAIFGNISLPDRLQGPAVLVVESMDMVVDSTANIVFEVRLRGVHHPRSYDTRTGGPSDLLCAYRGFQMTRSGITTNDAGLPLSDMTRFVEQPINIYLTRGDGQAFNSTNVSWVLVLAIIPQ